MPADRYLIRVRPTHRAGRGTYYRPKRGGYTDSPIRAGRYTREEAEAEVEDHPAKLQAIKDPLSPWLSDQEVTIAQRAYRERGGDSNAELVAFLLGALCAGRHSTTINEVDDAFSALAEYAFVKLMGLQE